MPISLQKTLPKNIFPPPISHPSFKKKNEKNFQRKLPPKRLPFWWDFFQFFRCRVPGSHGHELQLEAHDHQIKPHSTDFHHHDVNNGAVCFFSGAGSRNNEFFQVNKQKPTRPEALIGCFPPFLFFFGVGRIYFTHGLSK